MHHRPEFPHPLVSDEELSAPCNDVPPGRVEEYGLIVPRRTRKAIRKKDPRLPVVSFALVGSVLLITFHSEIGVEISIFNFENMLGILCLFNTTSERMT